jgi:hypothetical protein
MKSPGRRSFLAGSLGTVALGAAAVGMAPPAAATGTEDWRILGPETFGAVGDGVTDDTAAVQAAIDAAAAAGGGIVLLTQRYGWTGDLIHKPQVTVQGHGSIDYTVSAAYDQPGLVALDSTARYRYGQLGLSDAHGDGPGPLRDLVIDGANIGGATELFRAECVDGSVRDVYIIRSAGDGIVLASAQNSIFDHVHVGIIAGHGWVLRENVAGVSQGCGGNKIRNCYTMQWGGQAVFQHVDTGANYWCHDNIFDGCLFESYLTSFEGFVHMDNGETQFRSCVFTYSVAAGVASQDCMILLEHGAFAFATVATFDSCYFAGGTTAPPTDAIKSVSANQINFVGHNGVRGPAYVLGMEGGSSVVDQAGKIDIQSGGTQFVRLGTGGGHAGEFRKQYTGLRWQMPNSSINPVDIRQPTDAGFRIAMGSTGVLAFGDGTGTVVASMGAAFGKLQLQGILYLTGGLTLGNNVVASASGSVPCATGTHPLHELRCAANASVTVNLQGNESGRVVTVAVLGQGTNTLLWTQPISWGPAGVPAAPVSGQWLVVKLIYLNGGWVEQSRN